MSNIAIMYVTHNRIDKTQISLPAVLGASKMDFDLYIYDNGSTDGTQEYLASLTDPKIKNISYQKENMGLGYPHNIITCELAKDYQFVGKIDNDICPTNNWLEKFMQAFTDNPNFAVLGAHHSWNEWEEHWNDKMKICGNTVYVPVEVPGGNWIARSSTLLGKTVPGGFASPRQEMVWCTRADEVIASAQKDNFFNAYIIGVKFIHLFSDKDYYIQYRGDHWYAYLKHMGAEGKLAQNQAISKQINFLIDLLTRED